MHVHEPANVELNSIRFVYMNIDWVMIVQSHRESSLLSRQLLKDPECERRVFSATSQCWSSEPGQPQPSNILQDSAIGRPLSQTWPAGNFFPILVWSEHEQILFSATKSSGEILNYSLECLKLMYFAEALVLCPIECSWPQLSLCSCLSNISQSALVTHQTHTHWKQRRQLSSVSSDWQNCSKTTKHAVNC